MGDSGFQSSMFIGWCKQSNACKKKEKNFSVGESTFIEIPLLCKWSSSNLNSNPVL